MKLVFDTNVWVSALAFKGRVRDLLDVVIQMKIEVVVSPEIIEETLGVLSERKFGFSPDVIVLIDRRIRMMAKVVRPTERLRVVERDPDDDRILECAVAAGAEVIVTGDEHLLALKVFRGIRILTPTAFLDELSPGSTSDGAGLQEAPAIYKVPKTRKKPTKPPKKHIKKYKTDG
jgi:putative PIN family toxin of toxin-antitoxin system